MLYPRRLTGALAPFLKRREYLAIVGPRQAGKTTFLELLRKYLVEKQGVDEGRIAVVTFEDRRLLAQFEQDPVQFVQSYAGEGVRKGYYLMIDEFQYARSGGQHLKLVYDTIKGLKIIITGSSSLDIKAQVGKYMVGRILTFELLPFDFGEYLSVRDARLALIYRRNNEKFVEPLLAGKPIKIDNRADAFAEQMIKLYEDFAVWGGYPAVVLTRREREREKVLGEIYDNYVLKDVKTLLQLATEDNLHRLAQFLATQVGSLVVYQNLGQAAGLDFRNLKKHLRILMETYICREIRPFFRNRQKELSKNPKIYFNDTGFRNYLIENMNAMQKRTDTGAIMENAVLARLNGLEEKSGGINFWRTKAGAEVDFILHAPSGILPIEVKYSDFREAKVPRGLVSFIESFHPARALVLTRNYWGRVKRGKTAVYFVPLYYL